MVGKTPLISVNGHSSSELLNHSNKSSSKLLLIDSVIFHAVHVPVYD